MLRMGAWAGGGLLMNFGHVRKGAGKLVCSGLMKANAVLLLCCQVEVH